MNRLQLQTSCPAQRSETGGCARCVRACVCSIAHVPTTSISNINFKHKFPCNIKCNEQLKCTANINSKHQFQTHRRHQTSNVKCTDDIKHFFNKGEIAHRTWPLIDWAANFNESSLLHGLLNSWPLHPLPSSLPLVLLGPPQPS